MYVHHQLSAVYQEGKEDELAAVGPAVEHWVQVAEDAGMGFVVMVVKHEGGYCLWDSQDYDHDIGQQPGRLDPISVFVEACAKHGLVAGVHYSVGDRYNEMGDITKPPVPRPYFDLVLKHTRELHTAYPQVGFHLFDLANRLIPAQRRQLYDEVQRLNPACIVLLGGYQQLTPGSVVHLGPDAGLAEAAYVPKLAIASVLGKDWGWSPAARCAPTKDLYATYQAARQRGANLLLNVGPDRGGRITPAQVEVLTALRGLMAKEIPGASTPAPRRSAQERLADLKQLLQQGLIDQATHDRKAKEILDAL
jgi:alpha-L-fucosidase